MASLFPAGEMAGKVGRAHRVAFHLKSRIILHYIAGGFTMNYKACITIEPGKRGGKPCIRGLRITVYDVLDYLASGMTPAEIVAEFDYLTLEDVQACLAYAADREHHQLAVNA